MSWPAIGERAHGAMSLLHSVLIIRPAGWELPSCLRGERNQGILEFLEQPADTPSRVE
jgi:hypothetical protein